MPNPLPQHVVRPRDLRPEDAMHIRHPRNPNSDVLIHPLSRRAGMKQAHLNLGRVPPGKESFIPHSHAFQEEFIYILEGAGTALIGDARVPVGPGDFVGFPTDGVVHHLVNTGASDLVYLMGGEHTDIEISRFPSIGKVALFDLGAGSVQMLDAKSAETLSISEWMAKK